MDTNGLINVTMDYVLAGNATLTVQNAKGEHYTYKARRLECRDCSGKGCVRCHDTGKGPALLSLLSGPDNEQDYTYMGLVTDQGELRKTRGTKMTGEAPSWRVAAWALRVLSGGREIPAGYAIRHNDHCGRCGRTLTEPESLTSGLGPVCREALGLA